MVLKDVSRQMQGDPRIASCYPSIKNRNLNVNSKPHVLPVILISKDVSSEAYGNARIAICYPSGNLEISLAKRMVWN